ncbi:hypothetical protein K2173_007164 [Erythroxylum novogranatense]|uniref:Uncharacterized protein n=1 Tax=Erythroxylum novogranatense TaxID=1862640 RepID=A0AAV8SYR0_9ROSI|nr:hypothetical protein K2173_007164 [Erythroxylum novogranatense]
MILPSVNTSKIICSPSPPPVHHRFGFSECRRWQEQKAGTVTVFAAKSGGFSMNSMLKGCQKCGGKGAIECPGCKGKIRRMGISLSVGMCCRCFDCQGFGLKSCPSCGKAGLTPEQRGER